MRTLYRASRVYTLSYPVVGEWVLVDGRHIERVGTGDPPSADRIVALPGATIVPGFIDTHVHLTGTGVHHRAPELSSARSAQELLAAVGKIAAEGTGPLYLHGWDESHWTDRRIPSAEELDAVCARPLGLARVDGHVLLLNSAGLLASGTGEEPGLVWTDVAERPSGRVVRGAAEAAKRWFSMNVPEHEVEQLQLQAASLAVAYGVTTIHEMSMPAERGTRDLEILLAHRGRLPLDVVVYAATTDVSQVIDLGLRRIGGDLPVDGSIGARTAWVADGFVDDDAPEGYYGADELAEFFHDGHLAGLQVGVHAIGDAAIDQVVGTWERVYRSLDSRERRHFRARRHRVEHFEMADAAIVERAAMLGLAISVQPAFDAEWGFPGGLYEQGLGTDRAAAMNPFRDLVMRGLEVGAGSDSPITSIDPMVGIAAFETHHRPEQRLSRAEAIRVYTTGSARLAHQEDKKGSLEPGKHADLVAYDLDPMEAGSVEGIRPVLTVSLGRDVYAA